MGVSQLMGLWFILIKKWVMPKVGIKQCRDW